MQSLDYAVLIGYACILVLVGLWAFTKIKNSADFFVAGGKVPWWLSGVSHHVSGYSAVVFTGYAAIAYNTGFSIYIWWALAIATGMFIGSYLITPRWARLRKNLGIASPTGYLENRYNLPTQQLIAWSGVILKLLDVAAKWVAIAVVLNGFVGIDIPTGILIGSILSVVYIAFGGFWADLANDFFQFLIQVAAGIVMLYAVVNHFGGISRTLEAWQSLPAANRELFRDPYTPLFVILWVITTFMSYNGGTWNLAMRFISTENGKEARKTSILSAILYVVWPFFLFIPMWLGPAIFPGLENPSTIYAELAKQFIPAGFYGLVLGSMLAATLTMTASDTNALGAVISQDILPNIAPKYFKKDQISLRVARLTTICFTFLTVIIALNHEKFGGITGLIISWFGALLGPSATPMLLGLIPAYKHCDSKAAITSILTGFIAFAVFKVVPVSYAISVGGPGFLSLLVFTIFAIVQRKNPVPEKVTVILDAIAKD